MEHEMNNASFNTSDWIDDFEYEKTLYNVPPCLVVLLSICYGSISVLATIGNGLVIWVIVGSHRMRNVTNYYIANLAFADFLLALLAIPFEFQAMLLQRWNLPAFMCSLCPFIQSLSITVSVFTLTAIAVDRHKAILNPFRGRASKTKCTIVISAIWLAGIILSFPMGYAMEVIHVKEENNKPFCYPVRLSVETMNVFRAVLVLFQYVMPLSVITWAYWNISLTLWGNTTPGNAQTDRDANVTRNKKKVIKMLVIVVALFALCWLPLQTYNVLHGWLPEINSYKYINIIYFCFDWFAMSNSFYNPIIYAIYNEKFKIEFEMRLNKLKLREKKKNGIRRELSCLFSSGKYEWKSTARELCSTPGNEILLRESPSSA